MRVLIVDDHARFRRGAMDLLEEGLDDVSCGEAQDAGEALDAVRTQHWDLVLLDIALPGRNGFDLMGDIRHEQPQLPVLVVSMYPESQLGGKAVSTGCVGYVSKDKAPGALVTAVKTVLSGRKYFSLN